MSELDPGLPDVACVPEGIFFHGVFRFPHGGWRTLEGKDGQPARYVDGVSATRAALAHLMGQLFKPIVAERSSDLKTMAEALGVDDWKKEKERKSVETRLIHRGDGKKPIVEERRTSRRSRKRRRRPLHAD